MNFVKALSREEINQVIVDENFQPMVYVGNIPNLFFRDGLARENKYCRQDIAEKIIRAQNKLPDGVFFKLYFAYRSLNLQLELFNKYFEQIKKENPNIPLEEQERLTRLKVADPRNGKYGPHQTGGALDVTLCFSDGVELDMGGSFEFFSEKTRTYPLKNDVLLLNDIELKNRKILYDVLLSEGFVNYPLEWWHYSYGDKLWAAYSGKKSCFYGCVNNKIKFI